MPKAKHLSKDQVVSAMNKTKSVRAAARYLNVSYIHMKKWMKLYKNEDEISLFEAHKNQSGKGIPKFLSTSQFNKKEPAILDVIEGRIDPAHFNPQKIKYRLISEGYLKEECNNCGFHERRVSDYKSPLILHFKDKNKQHYRLENLEMLCYNCYYLTVGDVFDNKQIEGLEDHKPVNESQVDWELDDYTLQRLKELGLDQSSPPPDDGSEFISRI
jgi:hypothetical protein